MMTTADDNISIRTRIRKATTSINPEFGPSTESLLTFVDSTTSASQKQSSIVITPLSILSSPSCGGSVNGNNTATYNSNSAATAAWRSASPLRSQSAPRGGRALSTSSHNRKSFRNNTHHQNHHNNHPPLVVRAAGPTTMGRKSPVNTNNGGGDNNNGGAGGRLEMDLSNDSKLSQQGEGEEDGMVDISLDDPKLFQNDDHHHVNTTNDNHIITMELEAEWSNNNSSKEDETREDDNSGMKVTSSSTLQQQQQRCSTSPLPIVRSGSGLSPQSQDYQPHRLLANNSTNNIAAAASSSNNSLGSSTTNSHHTRSTSLSRSINARSRSFNKTMRARSHSRGGGCGGGSDSLTSSRGRSSNHNRPTSRSRGGSIGRGGAISLSGRRMRSASAANAFHTDTTNSHHTTMMMMCGDNDSLDQSCHNKYQYDEEVMIMETMSILLKDIISVQHETPKSKSSCSSSSVVAITRVASFTPPTPQQQQQPLPPPPPAAQPLYRPGSKLSTSSQPLSPSAHSNNNTYRIYIHTRMNGYLEFNFDTNSNSYEVVLTYLRCHLKEGMVPPDHVDLNVVVGSGGGVGGGPSSTSLMGGSSSLEQPINLTRTKSLSNKGTTFRDHGGDCDAATVTSTSTASISSSRHNHQSNGPPLLTRTNSSNPIERLQTKAINHQLQQEQTPINSMKHNVSGWLSSIVDCASFGCCQDTTVEDKSVWNGNGIQSTTPLRQSQSMRSQQSMTPRSKVLKRNGIGGLSFEVETVTSNMSGL